MLRCFLDFGPDFMQGLRRCFGSAQAFDAISAKISRFAASRSQKCLQKMTRRPIIDSIANEQQSSLREKKMDRTEEFRQMVQTAVRAKGQKYNPLAPIRKDNAFCSESMSLSREIDHTMCVWAETAREMAILGRNGRRDALITLFNGTMSHSERALSVCCERIDRLKQSIRENPSVSQNSAHQHSIVLSLFDALAEASAKLERYRRRFLSDLRPNTRPVSEDRPHFEEPDHMEQRFDSENADLKRELTEMSQSIGLAEAQLMEITALSTLFSSKLVEQSQMVSDIFDTASKASATMREAAEQLNEANSRRVPFRFCVLLFLLTASLMLYLWDRLSP